LSIIDNVGLNNAITVSNAVDNTYSISTRSSERDIPTFPLLRKSERVHEFNAYEPSLKAEVVYEYLFSGKPHRHIDATILGYDPVESRGWQSMGILHYLGLVDRHKGYFRDISLNDAIAFLEAENADYFFEIISYLRLYSERH
jgi:hypothetical protein